MTQILFADIRRILELRESTHVDDTPLATVPDRWALYRGETIALRYHYPVYFLHLMADCTLDDVRTAGASLVNPKVTDIIYAPSLEKLLKRDRRRDDDVQHWLRMPRDIISTHAFLRELLHDTLAIYQAKLAQLRPRYFVDPAVETVTNVPRSASRPLHAHLGKTTSSAVGVGVLLAEAGQGKTHITRQLAATLSTSLPIYVDSRLWRHVTPEHVTDPWKTIMSSFSWFGVPVPWVVDAEKEFVSILMRAGILSIIFDGFDEYIYWNRGRFDPLETLAMLGTLSDESSSGVLVTSRTSFWESDVARNGGIEAAHTVYRLIPFDRRHAHTFFHSRFDANEDLTDRAVTLYDSLRSTDADSRTGFVGRGFVLELLADLVSRTDRLPALPTAASVARRVMTALCEREQERQDLPLNYEQQLHALGIFAEAVAAGQAPTTDMLQLAIEMANNGLDPAQVATLVGDDTRGLSGQLAQHPLIELLPATREWRIRQDQVYYDLLAEQLLLCRDRDDPILRDFVEKILPDARLSADIATVLVDQACASGNTSQALSTLRRTIEKLLSYSSDVPTHMAMPEKDLACTIAMLMVNRLEMIGRPRAERCAALLDLLSMHTFYGLQFSGTIASMDFIGRSFYDCRFETVAWANCNFDSTTEFTRCRFIGGRLERCQGFGLTKMESNWADSDASIMIKSEQVIASARRYEDEDLRRDMALLIRKFAPREGFGTRSLEQRYLRSGTFSASPHRDLIIQAFQRHVLAEHSVGGRPAVHVRPEARDDVLFYITNGVLVGTLADAYLDIAAKLGIVPKSIAS